MAHRRMRKSSLSHPSPPNPYDPPENQKPAIDFNHEIHPRQAYVAMSELGASQEKLADLFNISFDRLQYWIETYPLLREAIRAGREMWDTGKAERTLYHRAMGYEYEEKCVSEVEIDSQYQEQREDGNWAVVVGAQGRPAKLKIPAKRVTTWYRKHPPDVIALIFWLKNRMPERWRDVRAVDVRAQVNGQFQNTNVNVDWDKVADEIGNDGLSQLRMLLGRVAGAGQKDISRLPDGSIKAIGGTGSNSAEAGASRAAA
jgi:hypothetical protein